jgi:two-component system phosphate regulon sensor histidine kinase PhoR
MSLIDQAKYSSIFSDLADLKPIHKRVSNIEIELLLQKEFKNRDLDLEFDYRVFNGQLATKVGSDRYTNLEGLFKYSMPIFEDEEGISQYSLVVGFPNRTNYLRSSISYLIVLSVLFTLIIILSFYFTVLNSIKQKNISEIKTDFINNMTHEFKTPIATIDLALNAIKNDKIKINEKLKLKYLNIINEENKRMNKQVENVLKISQLEKEKITLIKTELDLHDVINEAISRITLLLKTKDGIIKPNYNATKSMLNLSFEDLTNVFVNIFENSIKYSISNPEIEVSTINKNNQILIHVSDNGMGMSNKVKSKIFDKFYRESQGNIHNVKGHGLGLSFVKKIVDLHSGTISVSSQLKKGTEFQIIFDI